MEKNKPITGQKPIKELEQLQNELQVLKSKMDVQKGESVELKLREAQVKQETGYFGTRNEG